MMKLSFWSSILLGFLCGPALADSINTYRVDFALRGAGQLQSYAVFVADHSCGELTVKSPDREKFFRVCAQPTNDKRVKLDIERRQRDGKDESIARAVIVAAAGGSFDINDAKITVTAQ